MSKDPYQRVVESICQKDQDSVQAKEFLKLWQKELARSKVIYHAPLVGKWSSQPNAQKLPKDYTVNYEELEPRIMHFEFGGRPFPKTIDPHVKCPKCDVQWKETQSIMTVFYDCPKCGSKREDYIR